MRLIIVLVSLAAIALAIGIAVSGPGARFGYWDWSFGLGLIRKLALPTMIAAGVSAVALLLSLWKARGLLLLPLVGLIASAAAAAVPLKMKSLAESNPFIHDITTDFENPPQIIEGAKADRKNPAAYVGDEQAAREEEGVTVAEAQMRAFPDIQPIFVSSSIDEAAEAARTVLGEMGMEVVAEGPVSDISGAGWRIEAVYTSTWFGFKDDFIVRISPGEAGGARIDLRSKSRVGLSDLGANAERIRTFSEKLKAVT